MERILIYRLGSLGDTVIALPAFHNVRRRFPNARITLLTNRPVASVAAPLPAVLGSGYFYDDVLSYPVGTRNPVVLLKLIENIRQRRISLAINLTAFRSMASTWRDYLFFRAAGIRRLIGFSMQPRDRVVSVDERTHLAEWEARRLARRVGELGTVGLDDDRSWDLRLDPVEIAEAASLLDSPGGYEPAVAISLGTKVQAKDWGLANWKALIERLAPILKGWRLVLIGAAEERDQSESCLETWMGGVLNLCGRCSPRVSAAVLKQCRLFIGHDSGPMHLAACVGTPCVAIFSARNLPGQWFPRGNRNRILYQKTDCAGCGLDVCIEQRKKCLTGITVSDVERAVLESLDLSGSSISVSSAQQVENGLS